MAENEQVKMIMRMFFVSKRGRVPTKVAMEEIANKMPGLSKWKRGRLLKKCFGDNVRKGAPGKSKKTNNEVRTTYYYGIELVRPCNVKMQGISKSNNRKCAEQLQEPNCNELTKAEVSSEELVEEISCLRRENEKLQSELKKLKKDLCREKKRADNHILLGNKQQRKTCKSSSYIPRSMYVDPCDVLNKTCVIGRGSYGTCQVADYKGLKVAMKYLTNKEKQTKEKLRTSLEDEAKCMLALRAHRNLPHLVGLCVKDGNFFLLMNFWGSFSSSTALTVSEALRGNSAGSIPWTDVIRQIADGLVSMHDSGIVHNDIKGED